MPEEYLIDYGAPTLAGLKTGSLFRCPVENKNSFLKDLRRLNERLKGRGILLLPFKLESDHALLYLYRPEKLGQDLKDPEVSRLLRESGYQSLEQEACLSELIRRLRKEKAFPHEIGLFLGYPPEDVEGFMKLGSRKAKLSVGWQVYGDEDKAIKTARLHEKCTRCYQRCYRQGSSLEKLAVSL